MYCTAVLRKMQPSMGSGRAKSAFSERACGTAELTSSNSETVAQAALQNSHPPELSVTTIHLHVHDNAGMTGVAHTPLPAGESTSSMPSIVPRNITADATQHRPGIERSR
jgi:hypothetical protein